MGSNLVWSEEQLDAYRKRLSQNAENRTSGASAAKTVKRKGRSSPIRVAKPRQPNRTEERFNREVLLGLGIYEGVSFNCPGGRYTPDWVEFTPGGRMHCYEVKGSHAFHSQGRASFAFKDCVSRFGEVDFYWAKLEKNGEWSIVNGRTGEVLA